MEFHKLRARAAIVAALTMFFAAFAPGLAFAQSGLLATTANGRVEGRWQDGVRAFKGIPYAAPPVGDLRWRSPRPPASWTGVWPARDFGAPCPQASSKDIHERGMSEDCLTLNVWTPARGTGTKLPVMVWLHGGAFETGWTGLRMYDGSNIANHGVVMVTLNYRLGPLGFFGHPQLTEEAKAESLPTANYGLLDQIAALLWVKRNIEAFGGDASNVTLFGESAGGVSVLAMMTAPAAKGLFHKVIIQSGGGRWVAPSLTERSGNYLSAHEYGEEAARDFGLKPENAIAGLRA
ncbi:MAG: carboxylesterase/lipase family protein, partial [Rhodomicrobium sp.]